MSFHPNIVSRRARAASILLTVLFAVLLTAFFRTQILDHSRYALQSQENRLREVPLPAPRAIIYDRHGQVIAESIPGYSVSLLAPSADSLRAALRRLATIIELPDERIEAAVRRYSRAPMRPTVVLADAPFDVISVLEERRVEFPGLIIQSAPKRYYPDGSVVASFVGYTGEITEAELAQARFEGYKAGQQVGKGGLERQYEEQLRGREGSRFVEVDALGRVVREAGARRDLLPTSPEPLHTNIDLGLQRFIAELFADSLQGGAIVLDPRDGAVLALYSAPSWDPNRFIGGIPTTLWRELNEDPRRPLYNKVLQGRYEPGSAFKLATAVIAMQEGVASIRDRMPVSCTGGFTFGGRYFRCWEPRGHGHIDMARAIELSCNVYFYQLGLRLGVSRMLAGGVSLGMNERSGIDLPNEIAPLFPYAVQYYDRRYGPRGWTSAVALNLSIGQGENAQTVVNMARFYSALANGGDAFVPEVVKQEPQRQQIFQISEVEGRALRDALAGVVSGRGTAGGAAIRGVVLAGKTSTAQNPRDPRNHHAWFVGFAPAEDPTVVVAVMLEFGQRGGRAARIASRIVEHHLRTTTTHLLVEGE